MALLDATGTPITATFAARSASAVISRPTSPTIGEELATRASRGDWSWFQGILPNPDNVLRKAGKSQDAYKDLMTDPEVGALIGRRKRRTKRLKWFVNGENADPAATAFIEEQFDELDVRRINSEILDAVYFGYQPLEILFDHGDQITCRDIVGKPRNWFSFRSKDNKLQFHPSLTGTPIPVEDWRFLVAQHESTYDNPYGLPLLSYCFWPITFKRGGLPFWATFTEKYGMPWAWAKYPSTGIDQEDIDKIVTALDQLVGDGVGAFPENAEPDMQMAGSQASVEIYKSFLEYMDDQMSKVIMGHTKALDSTPGELGNSKEAIEASDDVAGDDLALCEKEWKRWVRIMCDFNFPPGIKRPVIEPYTREDIDKNKADRDVQLKNAGAVFTRKYFIDAYGFDDDHLVPDPEPATDEPPVLPAPADPQLADPQLADPQADDTVVDDPAADDPATDPTIDDGTTPAAQGDA